MRQFERPPTRDRSKNASFVGPRWSRGTSSSQCCWSSSASLLSGCFFERGAPAEARAPARPWISLSGSHPAARRPSRHRRRRSRDGRYVSRPAAGASIRHRRSVGFSGGGSSAPHLASNTPPYTAFALLHGGVFIGGCGSRRVRGWFSTGADDGLRTPDHVAGQCRTHANAGFDVVFSTCPGGHTTTPAETSAVVAWWLGAR
jgi:hypothetical protein